MTKTFAILVAMVMACAQTTTTTRVYTQGDDWRRPGTVESVQEIVERVEGDPALGAVAGALIGGFLFRGNGPGTLFGAAAGAAIGAAASQGAAEHRTFQVLVRFDDGSRGLFVFRDYVPFGPGAHVELSPQGLRPITPQ